MSRSVWPGRLILAVILGVLIGSCETERRMPESSVGLSPSPVPLDTMLGGRVLAVGKRTDYALLIHWRDAGGVEVYGCDTLYRRVLDVKTERGTVVAQGLGADIAVGDTIRFRKSALR